MYGRVSRGVLREHRAGANNVVEPTSRTELAKTQLMLEHTTTRFIRPDPDRFSERSYRNRILIVGTTVGFSGPASTVED